MSALPIIGLTMLAGYIFNKDGKVPREETIKTQIEQFEKPNGTNIYTSNIVNEANQKLLDKSLENYKKAENPAETGMLPPLYNTYSSVGRNVTLPSIDNLAKTQDFQTLIKYNDPKAKYAGNIELRPMFSESLPIRQQTTSAFNEDQQVSLLTGAPLEQSHINMVPFFGSSVKQNIETFSNESLLDNKTGTMSSVFQHKQEVPSMFETKPQDIYGTPLFTNQVNQDRFIPSVYRQNEKGTQDIKVPAPIAGTFDNKIVDKSQYKTIDELRASNKPQISYEGRTLAGQVTTVRGVHAEVKKQRPETYFEQSHDQLLTTTGEFIAPKVDENYDINFKNTSRQDYNLEYYGHVKGDNLKQSQRVRSIDNSDELDAAIFQDPKRNNFENDYLRNAGVSSLTSTIDYGKGSMTAHETERTTSGLESHILNPTKKEFGMRTRQQDNVKQTIKETTLSFDNSGNIKTIYDRGVSHAYNKGITDISFKTTNKETMILNNYKGNANKMEGMGYLVNKQTPRDTYKEETLVVDRAAGPQNFQIASGKTSYGDVKYTENMVLKESEDQREKINYYRSQIIPDKKTFGSITKYNYDDDIMDTVNADRLQPDLIQGQHDKNPYSIYNKNN